VSARGVRYERAPSCIVGFTHVSYYLQFELDITASRNTHARMCARVRDRRLSRKLHESMVDRLKKKPNRRVDFDIMRTIRVRIGQCLPLTIQTCDSTSSLCRVPYDRAFFSASSHAFRHTSRVPCVWRSGARTAGREGKVDRRRGREKAKLYISPLYHSRRCVKHHALRQRAGTRSSSVTEYVRRTWPPFAPLLAPF